MQIHNIVNIINKLLRTKGNIIKVRFSIGNKAYEAYVPDDEYWGSIKDVLLSREYEYLPLFNVKELGGFTVIDIGAHVGLYSLVVSSYARQVISIEPHPIIYRLLEINRIMNNVENMLTLNVAVVGPKIDSVELCESTHSGGSSIMIKSSKCYQVKALTLEELLKSYAADREVLIKMDIEGAEFEVFKSIDADSLRFVERLVMEVHLEYGSLNTIIDKLKSANFTVRYFHPPLIARNLEPPIKVQDLINLRMLRAIVYSLAKLCGAKDRSLVILFAWKQ